MPTTAAAWHDAIIKIGGIQLQPMTHTSTPTPPQSKDIDKAHHSAVSLKACMFLHSDT